MTTAGGETESILIVDDTGTNLQLLTGLLREHGYTVYPASDGELALEIVRAQTPDLILLDIRMPDMDGYEVCRRLKEDARTRVIPIIFISILEDIDDKVRGFQAGAVDYIIKPFQPAEVLARIQTHLRLKELTERLEQKVAQRTEELEDANRKLVTEMAERKKADEELQRLNRELRAISDCNQVLVRAEDEQTLLNEVCRIVCEQAGYRLAWVGYPEHDELKSLRVVAWSGFDESYIASARISWADTERGRGPGGTAIRTGRTAWIQDFATDPLAAPWRESALQHGYRSCICLPLKTNTGETFGALGIYSTESNAFDLGEIQLLEDLAGDLAFGIQALRTRIERARAEQQIELLSHSLDRVREAAFLIDESERFRYVNGGACRVLGYGREELLGLTVADIDPDFPPERWADHWVELKKRQSLTFEGRHRKKTGELFPVEISANYLEYGGEGFNLALARDISERKRAEEELHLQAIKLEQEVAVRKNAQEELEKLNASLEQRVEERTAELTLKNAELEQNNRLFVGRELRMVELKERIKKLEADSTNDQQEPP